MVKYTIINYLQPFVRYNSAWELPQNQPLSPIPFRCKPVLSVAEVAEQMGLSVRTVTRIFKAEPGTIALKRPEQLHKRTYTSIRIPRAVFERVLRRLSV